MVTSGLRLDSYRRGNVIATQDLPLRNSGLIELADRCEDSQGRYVLFIRRNGATDVVIAATGPRWSIVGEFLAYDPVLSPDKRWLAFRTDSAYAVYDLSKNRTEKLALATVDSFASYSFYWSPDSRTLVFADTQDFAPRILLAVFNGDNVRTYARELSHDDLACGDHRFLRAAAVNGNSVTVAICSAIRQYPRAEFRVLERPD